MFPTNNLLVLQIDETEKDLRSSVFSKIRVRIIGDFSNGRGKFFVTQILIGFASVCRRKGLRRKASSRDQWLMLLEQH